MDKEEIHKRKLTEFNKELSILKKCVAAFCLLILVLNLYYITRVSNVDTSLGSLMKKHKKTSKKINYVLENSHEKYIDTVKRKRIKRTVPTDHFNYTEEMKPFVDDYVERIDYPGNAATKKLFEIANAKLKEEISSFRMPFTKIQEYTSEMLKEQSNFFRVYL